MTTASPMPDEAIPGIDDLNDFTMHEPMSRIMQDERAYFEQPQAPSQQLTGERRCICCMKKSKTFAKDICAAYWDGGDVGGPCRNPATCGRGFCGHDEQCHSSARLVPVSADAQQVPASALTSKGVEPVKPFGWLIVDTLNETEDFTRHSPGSPLPSEQIIALYTSPQVPATVPEGCVVLQIADVRAIMQAAVDDTCITVGDFVEARKRIDYELHHAQSTESMSSEGGERG